MLFEHIFFTISLVAIFATSFAWNNRWFWRFARSIRRFATVEKAGIVIHYQPELTSGVYISEFLQSCQSELVNLVKLFGSPLPKSVIVFLFAHSRDISTIFGPRCGGLAILQANAIVVANDNRVLESLRHELAHLFSFRWNRFAAPLLSEGLSVWLQGTYFGLPIDTAALPQVRQACVRLTSLLRSKFFFSEAHQSRCYVLAGSFTGFLIRRYGWDCYRKLYRSCDGTRFREKVQKHIGVSLEKAEWQWRNEVIVMPILNRRLGKKPHC
ncbi:MAG TPA: hypothetical protein VH592_12035 [Gemmataceae bacterium]